MKNTWELRTQDTFISFALKDRPVITGFRAGQVAQNWISDTPETPLPPTVEVNGEARTPVWQYVDSSTEGRRVVFTYRCADPQMEIASTWRAARELPGPVEHDVTIRNKGGKTITFTPPLTVDLSLRTGHDLQNWWIEKTAGHVSEIGVHTDAMTPGYEKLLLCGPYSQTDHTRDAFPWFCLRYKAAEHVVYGGVEFTGWTEIRVRRQSDSAAAVSMGLRLNGGKTRTRLAPGEELRLPTCFVGICRGDVEDGANRLHRWVEKNLRPPVPGGITPLLVNNSWGSGMAVDEPLAKRMIDDCAELGVEMYHVDAGWFKEVGDWHSHPVKLPNGLEKIADYTHSKGLKFGLWVGWTQGGALKEFSPDVLTPFNPEQREWFEFDYPADWKNAEFAGATVCLGCPDAEDWCLTDLRRMVKQYKLDLLEHDQNMVAQDCGREGHKHIPNDRVDVSRAAAEGYYAVYDQLRKDYPNLLLEDCVNGGRLFDFGVAKRVHYICMSDDFAPLPIRKCFYDSSYPFPPSMLEAYIANHPGQTIANFRYMLRSAMMGWCTIMCDTSQWTPKQHEAAKREFKIYKERLRPSIASADLYHVLPRPDGKNWDGVQYARQRSEAVLYVFRPQSDEETRTIKLRGLDPKVRYEIDAVDGSASGTFAGKELMETGLAVTLPERDSSDLIFLTAIK